MIAAFRFSKSVYAELDANLENFDNSTLKAVVDGEEKEYTLGEGGSGVERKRLYTNPDTTIEQSTDAMFQESEIEGYQYLAFIVTDTTGSYEVEEWCEIAPLKTHGGQFIISMIVSGELYGRKIYRSSGAVKPSTGVYKLGATTENRNVCIIKSVDAVKGV